MTRDFNKPRRDDTRPSFRDRSSTDHGEERSSRPGRTRLNRETVDRAWESGAQHTHADYRPRSTNGQTPRNNWHNNQQPSGHSSSQNSHGGSRPYNNRQEPYRDNSRNFERTSDDSYGPRNPRARSFGPNTTGRQDYNNSRPGEQRPYGNARPGEQRPYGNSRPGEQRPYGNSRPGEQRPHGPAPRQDYQRDNGRPGGQNNRFQGQDRGRDNRRPDFERNERRGPGQYSQHSNPDTRNPRWQSRTWTRQASPEEQQEHSSRASYNEQFEGDYERFNNKESSPGQRDTSHRGSRPENPSFRNKPRREHEEESPAQERHVTRLSDGRVIKGPRPIQRQEARFWTEVNNDTETLVGQVQPEEKVVNGTPDDQVDGVVSDTADKPAKKPRARSASATVRSRKAATAPKEKTRGVKPKPSQRGFQWPTP